MSRKCDPSSFVLVCRLALYPVKINTHYDQLSLLLSTKYPKNNSCLILKITVNIFKTLSGLGLMTNDQPPAYIPTASNYCAILAMLASSKYGIASSYDIMTNIWHCIILFFLTVHIILLVTLWPWHLASYCCMELLNNMSSHLTQYMSLWHPHFISILLRKTCIKRAFSGCAAMCIEATFCSPLSSLMCLLVERLKGEWLTFCAITISQRVCHNT